MTTLYASASQSTTSTASLTTHIVLAAVATENSQALADSTRLPSAYAGEASTGVASLATSITLSAHAEETGSSESALGKTIQGEVSQVVGETRCFAVFSEARFWNVVD
ncbi:hypothetical protein CI15_07650 [Paraburkholderia monticola]|uniref:Uncharacterized protein n=1 Tax=Paraburkholderia monticola TaxID=1399968 RepID=A0A149PYA0_9BURK|nr:hypothetical protein [Paraburkholderia monticola]KXU90035.1 hypothetical protein CI15_07650 [Paraburkholderia monticola]